MRESQRAVRAFRLGMEAVARADRQLVEMTADTVEASAGHPQLERSTATVIDLLPWRVRIGVRRELTRRDPKAGQPRNLWYDYASQTWIGGVS